MLANTDTELGAKHRTPVSDETVAIFGEHALIERIRARVGPPPDWVRVGIGDDAAVIEPERGRLDVATTDALVERVHFDRAFVAPTDIGFKALAVNLSDLAAMGALPRAALLSLGLPSETPVDYVDALVDGLLTAVERYRVALVGGNITRSPGGLFVSVTAFGSVHPRRVLTRSGARPGDELFLSGTIGAAAAGLARLLAGGSAATAEDDPTAAECLERYLRPEPRVRLGLLVGRNRAASACVDLSDGLADAVRQLAKASGVGASIDEQSVPINSGARLWYERHGAGALVEALQGGDDYELLFSVPRKSRKRLHAVARIAGGPPLTRVGVVTADRSIRLMRAGRESPLPPGFVHF